MYFGLLEPNQFQTLYVHCFGYSEKGIKNTTLSSLSSLLLTIIITKHHHQSQFFRVILHSLGFDYLIFDPRWILDRDLSINPFSCLTKPINSSSSSLRLSSRFLGSRVVKLRIGLGPSNGSRATCWFKFGKNGVDAENAGIYGSQSRDDFDRDDVEQYFNYMGMLAVEGTYDKMEALLNQNIHPVDILLMLAASEGDKPKIEELLRAGADYTVKDADGRTAIDRASSEEIRDLILGSLPQKA